MSNDLVTIAAYPQPMQAHAARNYLKENGIRAFVVDEYTAVESWPTYIEAKVQVATADAERAKLLLASITDAPRP